MKSNIQSDRVITVVIADDQLTVRTSLQLQLREVDDIKIVAMVDNGISALEKVAELTPNIIIIDLEMPNLNGITAIEQIGDRFTQTKTLVLSAHDERDYINQAIIAGAKGYLLKGTSTEDLIDAIRKVDRGYFQLGSGLLEKISLSTSQVSLDSERSRSPRVSNEERLSNVESALLNKVKNLVDIKINNNYEKVNSLLQSKIKLVTVEQSKISSQINKIEFKFYLMLCCQLILLLIFLFKF